MRWFSQVDIGIAKRETWGTEYRRKEERGRKWQRSVLPWPEEGWSEQLLLSLGRSALSHHPLRRFVGVFRRPADMTMLREARAPEAALVARGDGVERCPLPSGPSTAATGGYAVSAPTAASDVRYLQ
jgi:hypothetical protein